jgi:hypothetical protein
MKTRVNKDTNTYCWLWSANCYESIEEHRKKWVQEHVVRKKKKKSKKKHKKKL